MSVSLQKGQGVSLQKRDGSQLTLVRMGVGWDPIKKRGLSGAATWRSTWTPPP